MAWGFSSQPGYHLMVAAGVLTGCWECPIIRNQARQVLGPGWQDRTSGLGHRFLPQYHQKIGPGNSESSAINDIKQNLNASLLDSPSILPRFSSVTDTIPSLPFLCPSSLALQMSMASQSYLLLLHLATRPTSCYLLLHLPAAVYHQYLQFNWRPCNALHAVT